MHFILIIAMLFIIYEAYKLVFTQRQMSVLGDLERLSRTKNAMENRALKSKLTGSFLHKATLTIEFGYIIFCFSLLFTRAWYVSLMLIVLVFLKGTINKLGVSKKFVWIADCILSISLLTIVVMIYI